LRSEIGAGIQVAAFLEGVLGTRKTIFPALFVLPAAFPAMIVSGVARAAVGIPVRGALDERPRCRAGPQSVTRKALWLRLPAR